MAGGGVGASLHFDVDLAGGETLGERRDVASARALLPGQQGHDDQRADKHGRERGSGVFEFEADDVQFTRRRGWYSGDPDILRSIVPLPRLVRPPE